MGEQEEDPVAWLRSPAGESWSRDRIASARVAYAGEENGEIYFSQVWHNGCHDAAVLAPGLFTIEDAPVGLAYTEIYTGVAR